MPFHNETSVKKENTDALYDRIFYLKCDVWEGMGDWEG